MNGLPARSLLVVITAIALLFSITPSIGSQEQGLQKIKIGLVQSVVLGDSIALSARASDPSKTGWPAQLEEVFRSLYPQTNIRWTILGLNGSGIDYALERSSELPKNSDVIYICTGRNDAHGYSYAQFKTRYGLLLKKVKEKAPQGDIICLVEPPQVSADDSRFEAIRQAILDCARDADALVADTWLEFKRDNRSLETLLADGLHPNDFGYELIAHCVLESVGTQIEP